MLRRRHHNMKKPNKFAAFIAAAGGQGAAMHCIEMQSNALATQARYNAAPAAPGPCVLNSHPSITPTTSRLAIIGEAHGADEELQGKPFVGHSGRLLNDKLSRANLIRDQCFVGNVCQYRPPNNDISLFSLAGPEIQDGLAHLGE